MIPLFLIFILAVVRTNIIHPPRSKRIPHEFTLFNVTIIDNYSYFSNKSFDKDYISSFLQSETEYADSIVDKRLTDTFFSELKSPKSVMKASNGSFVRVGEYDYFSERDKRPLDIWYRVKADKTGDRELVLDVNDLAKKYDNPKFFKLGKIVPTLSGHVVAYSFDKLGNEIYTIGFIDMKKNKNRFLTSGKDNAEELIENAFLDLFWNEKEDSIVYELIEKFPTQPQGIMVHKIHTTSDTDVMIYHSPSAEYELTMYESSDSKFIFVNALSFKANFIGLLKKNFSGGSQLDIFMEPSGNVQYLLDHWKDDYFFIQSTEYHTNFEVGYVNVNFHTGSGKVQVNDYHVIHAGSNVFMIEEIKVLQNYLLILMYNTNEYLEYIYVYNLNDESFTSKKILNIKGNKEISNLQEIFALDFVSLQDQLHSTVIGPSPYYSVDYFDFTYSSFITPEKTFRYDISKNRFSLLSDDNVNADGSVMIDGSKFHSQLHIVNVTNNVTHEWAKVPLFISYKKDLYIGKKYSHSTYAFVNAYGAYGTISKPSYRSDMVPLLNRKFMYVLINPRGSSMSGMDYYYSGKKLQKKHTFEDVIGALEYLIENEYSSSEKIVLEGRSAGGLTVGAVSIMRPDLMNITIATVPFVDTLNTMLDESLALTLNEYEEWGNPHEYKYFKYILSYSPYDNIKQVNYPNFFLEGGLNDPRVNYWEPIKFAQSIRYHRKNHNALTLCYIYEGGHFGGVNDDKLRQNAKKMSFIYKTLTHWEYHDPFEWLYILAIILSAGALLIIFMSLFIVLELNIKKRTKKYQENMKYQPINGSGIIDDEDTLEGANEIEDNEGENIRNNNIINTNENEEKTDFQAIL